MKAAVVNVIRCEEGECPFFEVNEEGEAFCQQLEKVITDQISEFPIDCVLKDESQYVPRNKQPRSTMKSEKEIMEMIPKLYKRMEGNTPENKWILLVRIHELEWVLGRTDVDISSVLPL